MRPLLLLTVACATPGSGQKVQALLTDEKLFCEAGEEGEPARAELVLNREDELYLAEIVDLQQNLRLSLPAVRDGQTVWFTCPDGLESFTVRRVLILDDQQPRSDTPAPPTRTR